MFSATKANEIGLPVLADNEELYHIDGGGLLALQLFAGDAFSLCDLEGKQTTDIACFLPNGQCGLAALGLTASGDGGEIIKLLGSQTHSAQLLRFKLKKQSIDVTTIKKVARVFSIESLPTDTISALATADCFVIITALSDGVISSDVINGALPATAVRVLVTRKKSRQTGEFLLPEPLAEPVDEFLIERTTAKAYTVKQGDFIQIIDVFGRQCSDFTAFNADALQRGQELMIDGTNTRYVVGAAYPTPGLFSKFYDENQHAMIELYQDTVGRHDTFGTACTAKYYEDLGYFGHRNCSDNFNAELKDYAVHPRLGWSAINLFYNTNIDENNVMTFDEPWSRPGDYVLFKALTDLLCLSSACPCDVDAANGWQPSDIFVRIYRPKKNFNKGVAYRMKADSPATLTKETGFQPRVSQLTESLVEYKGYWLANHYHNYGAIKEYHACRNAVTVMDLSALRKFEVLGPDAQTLLQLAATRDIKKLAVGQVVYTAMCYEHGGMVDDGTVFRLSDENFRWICGDAYCGQWLREIAEKHQLKAWVKSSTDCLHNIAVQGPNSRDVLKKIIWTPSTQTPLSDLGWFRFSVGRLFDANGAAVMVSRTGYTGELGYEVFCHPSDAPYVWDSVMQAGVDFNIVPMGLEALDLLRIEAGLIFADYEFNDQTDPFEAGIGFTTPLKSKSDDFIGKAAIIKRQQNPRQRLVGLEIEGNELCVKGDCVHAENGRAQIGEITSAMRSPLLGKNIALCRLHSEYCDNDTVVEVGKLDGLQKRMRAKVVPIPFYDPTKSRVRA